MDNKFPSLHKVLCSNKECDFEEMIEPDEYGINYFQSIGVCPFCGSKTIYENGEFTQKTVYIKLNEHERAK